MKKLIFVLFGLMFLLTACGQYTPTIEPEPTAPAPSATPPDSPISPISPIEPTRDRPAQPQTEAAVAAIAYLARELGLSPEEVTIIESTPVDWPDTSLGCPQEGMMYAAVITPGYRFLLEADGQQYEVHTDETGNQAVSCDDTAGTPL